MINFSGVLFALLTTLSWTFCIFPFTQAARRLGVNTLNHFRLLLATVFLCITSIIIDADSFAKLFSDEYLNSWLWLGLSGIVGLTLGDYFAFRMYAILGARVGSVLTTFSPAAALIAGIILLNENVYAIGVAGIIITIAGVMTISLGKKERAVIPDRGHGSIKSAIVVGVLSAICQGVGLVLSKKGMTLHEQGHGDIPPLLATFMRISIAMSSLFLVTLVQRKHKEVFAPILSNREGGIKYAVMGTIFGPFLGVLLSLYTVSKLHVSVAQTIFSLVPVCALVFAFIFLKEKITRHAIVGVVVAILGVVILIWREKLLLFF
jgi:drug/metabolite transporter (DMT)-like permease